MKEAENKGEKNHLGEYFEALIINLKGALDTYDKLSAQKQYLYVINNLEYLSKNPVDFKTYRKIILKSTKNIDNLLVFYRGEQSGEKRI
jgi:hypothetical protein